MRREDLPLDTIDDNFFDYLVQYRSDYYEATSRVLFCFGGLNTARFWFNAVWPKGLHLTPESVVETLDDLEETAEDVEILRAWEIADYINLIVLHANLSDDVLSAIRESENWWAEHVDGRDSVRVVNSRSRSLT